MSLLAYVETYGCQMNVADTEMVLGLLQRAGYQRTGDPAQADVILINTCAVREKAVERVWGRASTLATYKMQRPHVVLGITGCMAEHLRGQLRAQAPFVDLVLGPDSYRRLVAHIEEARAGAKIDDTVLDAHETYQGLDPARDATGAVVGRIAVQRGCDRFCSFCVVPYTRGRERGTSPDEVLRQAAALVAAGGKEVQLLGQTVTSYRHGDMGFASLLRALAALDGLERIRFMSPYPLGFSQEVIAAMGESPKICKHIHLPLQSASDAVLARMRRGYSFAQYRDLVNTLRAALPGVAITTDVLVGFCGETEQEFAEILRALHELRFDNAFTFAYSERQNTSASRTMADDVAPEVKQQRLAQVIEVQRQITGEIHAAQVGRRERVLLEAPSRRSTREFLGRTDSFRSVIVPAGPDAALGALVDVAIERANPATLFGSIVT
jgi:tRNA-2-methylthio-N6-dimethylallyladenosine synthase